MISIRNIIRLLALLSVMALAACETTQTKQTAESTGAEQTQTETNAQLAQTDGDLTDEQLMSDSQQEGAPVAVFLADTAQHEGWHEIPLEEGSIFLNPEAVVVREDLTGVQAGSSQQGDGLVALELSSEGRDRVRTATSANPGMRLAFIVGQTLLAAPGYAETVDTEHLVFVVGSEDNAMAVARAIAGASEEEAQEAAQQ